MNEKRERIQKRKVPLRDTHNNNNQMKEEHTNCIHN